MLSSDTTWLNLTNIGLGLVVLICVMVVTISVAREIFERARKRAQAAELDGEVRRLVTDLSDDHLLHTPGIGLTMADGGERIPEQKDPRA